MARKARTETEEAAKSVCKSPFTIYVQNKIIKYVIYLQYIKYKIRYVVGAFVFFPLISIDQTAEMVSIYVYIFFSFDV